MPTAEKHSPKPTTDKPTVQNNVATTPEKKNAESTTPTTTGKTGHDYTKHY